VAIRESARKRRLARRGPKDREQLDDMRQLKAEGWTVEKIADEYGVTVRAVQKYLAEHRGERGAHLSAPLAPGFIVRAAAGRTIEGDDRGGRAMTTAAMIDELQRVPLRDLIDQVTQTRQRLEMLRVVVRQRRKSGADRRRGGPPDKKGA